MTAFASLPQHIKDASGPVVVAGLFRIFVMWWKWAMLLAGIDTVIRKIPYAETIMDRLMILGVNILPGVFTVWIIWRQSKPIP